MKLSDYSYAIKEELIDLLTDHPAYFNMSVTELKQEREYKLWDAEQAYSECCRLESEAGLINTFIELDDEDKTYIKELIEN